MKFKAQVSVLDGDAVNILQEENGLVYHYTTVNIDFFSGLSKDDLVRLKNGEELELKCVVAKTV